MDNKIFERKNKKCKLSIRGNKRGELINMPENEQEQLVKKIVKTFNFDSKFYQIGDIIESDNRHFLVLSIERVRLFETDRKSTRLNSSHVAISYAVFCLKKKINEQK